MSLEPSEFERRIEAFFARERGRLRAPVGLWARIEPVLAPPASAAGSRGRRWPALAASLAAAVALGLGLFIAFENLGGGGQPDAREVLAGALDTLADPERVGLHSFRGTAETEVETKFTIPSVTIGPGGTPVILPTATPLAAISTRARAVSQIAFRAPNQLRVEVEEVGSEAEALSGVEVPPLEPEDHDPPQRSLLVADGETIWEYDYTTNTYGSRPLDEALLDMLVLLHPGSFGERVDLAGLLRSFSAGAWEAELVGEDTYLGRPVYVVEVSLAATISHNRFGGEEELSGGTMRLWLDREYLFTLRFEMEDDSGLGLFPTERMRFTEIEFNPDLPDSLFQFTPPPGARLGEVADEDEITAAEEAEPVEAPGPVAVETPPPTRTPEP